MFASVELDLGGGGGSGGAINVPLLVCFGAFVITFVTTRIITRMIRAGKGPFHDNVSGSGVHIHHAVPGIILLITGAFVAVGTSGSDSGWTTLAALLVGVGTSLVLDEFALILHLQDVYWADEGRISVEMVSLAIACLGLALVGLTPFDFRGAGSGAEGAVAVVATLALLLGWIIVSIMKGKYKLALFGAFVPLVALVAAVRLARPESRWAKRHYSPQKLARAQARTAALRRPVRAGHGLGERLHRRQAVRARSGTPRRGRDRPGPMSSRRAGGRNRHDPRAGVPTTGSGVCSTDGWTRDRR